MNTDLTSLLHEGLDRLEGQAGPPAGLVERARRRARRQRRVRGLAAAGGAAAAVAVGVLVARPELAVGPPAQARTAAYVLTRAADATQGRVMVATMPLAGYGRQGSLFEYWAYKNRVKTQQSIGTRVMFTELSQTRAGQTIVTTVVPPDKAWGRMVIGAARLSRPRSGCGRSSSPSFLSSPGSQIPADFASYVRATLACGSYTVAGHAQIGGVDTIRLRYQGTYKAAENVTIDSHGKWIPEPGSRGHLFHFHYTLFVNAATYLPVQMADMGPQYLTGTAFRYEDFRWLPATPANRALLKLTIPRGYHKSPQP